MHSASTRANVNSGRPAESKDSVERWRSWSMSRLVEGFVLVRLRWYGESMEGVLERVERKG